MSEPSAVPSPPEPIPPMARRVLVIVAVGQRSGRAVIEAVRRGQPDVNDATVYHHLGALQDDGLVAGREVDGQRNQKAYHLTDAGREWLRRLRAWEDHYAGGVVEDV